MAFVPDYRTYAPGAAADGAAIDAGLRSYMLRVYNWMASGLLLTGIVAYGIANTSLIKLFYHQVATPRGIAVQPTILGYAAIFAPLAFVMVLSFGVNRLSRPRSRAVLGLRRRDGRVDGEHLPDLQRCQHRAGVLHHRRDLRRHEHLRLHHEGRPEPDGQLPDHGPDRRRRGQPGQHVHRQHGDPVRDQRRRRAGLRGPDRLRHAADQGRLRAVSPMPRARTAPRSAASTTRCRCT